MNRCLNCNVWIADHTQICPLCNSVLEEQSENMELQPLDMEMATIPTAPYPDVRKRIKWFHFMMRVLLFGLILLQIVLFIWNKTHFHGLWWSAISAVAIMYGYGSLMYWMDYDSGRTAKLGVQVVATILLLIVIDYLLGFQGWSINIALPIIVIVGDAVTLIVMLTYQKQWYSYTLLLCMFVVCSLLLSFLYWKGILQFGILTIVAVSMTGVFVIGVLVFGGRDIRRELQRRFRV